MVKTLGEQAQPVAIPSQQLDQITILHAIQHTDRNLSWWRTRGIRFTVNAFGSMAVAGRQILYIEVRPGLSREIPAWMCDAAACAAVSCESPRRAVAALTELRAVLDGHSAEQPSDGSSMFSTVKENLDEASLPRSTDARSRSRRQRVLPGTAPEGLLQALADLLLEASGEEISRRVPTICPVRNGWARTSVTHL
jgi:hypothetical protein